MSQAAGATSKSPPDRRSAPAMAATSEADDVAPSSAWSAQLPGSPPTVGLVGFQDCYPQALGCHIRSSVRLTPHNAQEATNAISTGCVDLLCVGAKIPGSETIELLECLSRSPRKCPVIVLASAEYRGTFREISRDTPIFYLGPTLLRLADLALLIEGAIRHEQLRRETAALNQESFSTLAHGFRWAEIVWAQASLEKAAMVIEEAFRELVPATRVRALLYDDAEEVLWSPGGEAQRSWRTSASLGIAGFVARTGSSLIIDRVGRDPRFDPGNDDPFAEGDERLLVSPVGEDRCLAVLTLIRRAEEPRFTQDELVLSLHFCRMVAPSLSALWVRHRLEQAEQSLESSVRQGSRSLFRADALSARGRAGLASEAVARLPHRWLSFAPWLLLLCLVVFVLGLTCLSVPRVVSGTAIVQTIPVLDSNQVSRSEVLSNSTHVEEHLSLVGSIPAGDLPLLTLGQAFRLTLDGFPDSEQQLEITSLRVQPLTSDTSGALSSPSKSDAVNNQEPTVVFSAKLPGPSFRARGQTWAYRPGMTGSVRFKIGETPLYRLLRRRLSGPTKP